MVKSEHMCVRCGKIFKKSYFLKRHQSGKTQCKFIRLDEYTDIDTDENSENSNDYENNKDDGYSGEEQEVLVENEDLPTYDFGNVIDPDDQTSASIMIGIRRSGKTTLLRYLYPKLTSYDIVLFISNSIHNSAYDFVSGPKFDDQHTAMFRDLLFFQKKTSNMFKIMIILDDCVSNKLKNDDKLLQLFVRGRNSSIGTILSSQSMKLCNRNNRSNCDKVYIGAIPNGEFRKDIIEAFLLGCSGLDIPKSIKTKHQKIDYLNKWLIHHTRDHRWIIIDNVDGKVYGFRVQLD